MNSRRYIFCFLSMALLVACSTEDTSGGSPTAEDVGQERLSRDVDFVRSDVAEADLVDDSGVDTPDIVADTPENDPIADPDLPDESPDAVEEDAPEDLGSDPVVDMVTDLVVDMITDPIVDQNPDQGDFTLRGFEKFTITNTAGPCMPERDCHGFREVAADGTLRINRFGELPVTIHEASITRADLARAVETLNDADLIALLSLSDPPCIPPTDIFERMELIVDGVTYSNSTTFCADEALTAARTLMNGLEDTYLPEE